jgi:predicted nucleic acid-binding protein
MTIKTPASGTDAPAAECLIAQCALENELILLHHDKDFQQLEKVAPQLRQKHFLG